MHASAVGVSDMGQFAVPSQTHAVGSLIEDQEVFDFVA